MPNHRRRVAAENLEFLRGAEFTPMPTRRGQRLLRANPRTWRPSHKSHMSNPVDWEGLGARFARIIVGFKVGNRVRWKMDDLIRLWKAGATEFGRTVRDATFVAQKGIWTSFASGRRREVVEPGGSITILNVGAGEQPSEQFDDFAIRIGEWLCRTMKQESVIVEIGTAGHVDRVLGITR